MGFLIGSEEAHGSPEAADRDGHHVVESPLSRWCLLGEAPVAVEAD